MKPTIEPLKVTWKIVRRPYSYTRTPKAYCTYIAENENHKHRLRAEKGTELFNMLSTTVVSKDPRYFYSIYVDGVYYNNNLVRVTNPRKV